MNSYFKSHNFISLVLVFFKKPFLFFSRIYKKFHRSAGLMSRIEKKAVLILIAVFFILIGIEAKNIYLARTKPVPGFGGTYKEAMVGEFKYLDPTIVSSDIDKSASKLIFSSLVDFDRQNNIIPDLAQSWQISDDNLKYTFNLRDDVFFSDGEKLTSADVEYTVNKIQDPVLKSPLYQSWKDVEVSVEGDSKIIFTLAKPYGPFIYNCDFGVLPSHVSDDIFSKKFIGSGPFKYDKIEKNRNQIPVLHLIRNDNYFREKPFLSKINLEFYSQKEEAKKAFRTGETDGLFGAAESSGIDLTYDSSKKLGLIFNLRKDKLKDKGIRQKIVTSGQFDQKMELTLVTLDAPVQRERAESIKSEFAKNNITLLIDYKSVLEIQDSLKEKNYELLLYGFDFGNDLDPYPFWHSSRINDSNFAGYSDKKSDILIEDARMITDGAERKKKYDEFYNIVTNEYMAIFYDCLPFNFHLSGKIKNLVRINGSDSSSRYSDIEKWYIKEARVKK